MVDPKEPGGDVVGDDHVDGVVRLGDEDEHHPGHGGHPGQPVEQMAPARRICKNPPVSFIFS